MSSPVDLDILRDGYSMQAKTIGEYVASLTRTLTRDEVYELDRITRAVSCEDLAGPVDLRILADQVWAMRHQLEAEQVRASLARARCLDLASQALLGNTELRELLSGAVARSLCAHAWDDGGMDGIPVCIKCNAVRVEP
jgi:hypothetical protein